MHPSKLIWKDGEFVPWDQAQTHVLTHSLHYGGAVFEGIRCYETERGPAIFRLNDHMDRFLYSMEALKMHSNWTAQELSEAVIQTVQKNQLTKGYIRPLAFFGYGKMGLRPDPKDTRIIIACWPWGKYLAADAIKLKISSYRRIHPATTNINAKLSGHYVNSILASQELEGTEFDEALFLDSEGNLAEGPGENLFIVKDGKLLTPGGNTILKGFTRETVIKLAKDLEIPTEETTLTPKDLFTADEAFLTGTAAEISPICQLDEHKIPVGPIAAQIAQDYQDLVHGKLGREEWLSYA